MLQIHPGIIKATISKVQRRPKKAKEIGKAKEKVIKLKLSL